MKEEKFINKIQLKDIYHKRHEFIEKLNNIHLEEGNPDKGIIMVQEDIEKDLKETLQLDPRNIVFYYGVFISDEFVGINMLVRDLTHPKLFNSHLSLVASVDKNPLIVGLINRKIYELALTLR